MTNPTQRRLHSRRGSWCCSFTAPPKSPENPKPKLKPTPRHHHHQQHQLTKHDNSKFIINSNSSLSSSIPNSPQMSKFVPRIDPRRILSPGRVSPIDSVPTVHSIHQSITAVDFLHSAKPKSRSSSFRGAPPPPQPPPQPVQQQQLNDASLASSSSSSNSSSSLNFDVRLSVKGKNGIGSMVLELNSGCLAASSELFASLIAENNNNQSKNKDNSVNNVCRIQVGEVENLGAFKETIELMFEDDITKRLMKLGVYKAIDILEVSAGIMFTKGVLSCLTYLEAVPWTEEEEDKLRTLFTRFKFDDTTTRDIFARLQWSNSVDSQENIARQLVRSITTSVDTGARNELKSLVKGILCKSSIYEKDQPDINKDDLYAISRTCLNTLCSLFNESSSTQETTKKSPIERISQQVDNINWLLEILFDWQMAEEFVYIWADQKELLKLREIASPMVRYELSRVSAILFIAMGTRKLHCRSEARSGLFESWFVPMLSDFGWLQRCKKGLDIKTLEEAIGQTLLTLPLKQQYALFMEWFRCFSKNGTECPNLSKAFQIWWRRSFLKGSETHGIESR
ncbi:hypothetical protein ACFE04_012816 [Oxalis oulophora]